MSQSALGTPASLIETAPPTGAIIERRATDLPRTGVVPQSTRFAAAVLTRNCLVWSARGAAASAEGTAGSVTVNITWQDPRLDFDMYLYRIRRDGALVKTAIAYSASGGTTQEQLTYYPALASNPIEPDDYLIVVDNWCTNNSDRRPPPTRRAARSRRAPPRPCRSTSPTRTISSAACPSGLATNPLPNVSLAGPDTIKQNEVATFAATASDNGQIRNYTVRLTAASMTSKATQKAQLSAKRL
jgi:hypothetical protein